MGGEPDERSGGSLPLEIGESQSASSTGFKKVFLGLRNPMLRPVELLRGGMKFGDAKFSYVIAGMGWRMATEDLSHAKTNRNKLFWQNLKSESIATLSKAPFDALSLATIAFQVAVHLL